MKHETAVPIGSGGMGEVFKAWDPDLERHVAFKYLKNDDPVMVERLMREARAQARVDHPSVCKVYEVGEDDGRPFIAMEFVDGVPLDAAAAKLTLEQKILLVRKVTEAVQAAHSAGLVHRDLKPANILVVDRDGRPHPYVLDFGIARLEEVAGLTNTGQVIGTPGYLSPEQARGDLKSIDRRTDVFSLGVILYELLADARPFKGDSNVETLMHLIEDEPAPLRTLAPNTPRDLETVVMTCLEKNPERRYPSARALADDLGRFLAGEPVAARPVTGLERLYRRARRHPGTTALSILSLIAIIALSGIAVHSRWTASRQAEVAQRFGSEVERISSTMRIAHLAPLHDLSPEKAFVEGRLEWIQTEMARLGGGAEGPGHFAIGRGHLALGRPDEAREHLEAARTAGFQTPDVFHALGEAYGALYLGELEIAQRTRNADARRERVEQIQTEFREPALEFLAAGAGAGAQQQSPDYVEAQIAFFEERYDDAIVAARAASESHSWFYEAKVMEGRALYQQGMEQVFDGRYQGARDSYETARDAIEEAAEIGRSDPITHEALCISWHLVLEADRAEGRSIEEAYGRILETCGRALAADPRRAAAHEKIARAHWRWGEVLLDRGEDPISTFEGVVTAARAAVDADASCFRAANIEGLAWWRRARYEFKNGMDPRPSLDDAADALERTLAINPNYRHAYNNLGLVLSDKGKYEVSIGIDPTGSFARAVERFNAAIEVDPEYIYPYNNLSIILKHQARAEVATWGDPEPKLEQSAAAARKGIEKNQRYANALNSLAQTLLDHAAFRLDLGLAVPELLEEASDSIDKAIEINPSSSDYHATRAHCRFMEARELVANGADPNQAVDAALASLDDAFAINPQIEGGKLQVGWIHALLAETEARRGRDPSGQVTQARRYFEEATILKGDDNQAHLATARNALLEARFRLSRGLDPGAELDSARAAADRSSVGKYNVAPHLITARTHLVEARWLHSRGRSPAPELEAAQSAVNATRDLVPHHPDAALLSAEIALLRQVWSGGDEPEGLRSLEQAIKAADDALSLRPSQRRTRAVRAALVIQRSRLTDSSPAPEDRDRAVIELDSLTASDALLRSEFRSWTGAR